MTQTKMALSLTLVALAALTLAAVNTGPAPGNAQDAARPQGIRPDQVFRLPPRPTPTPARTELAEPLLMAPTAIATLTPTPTATPSPTATPEAPVKPPVTGPAAQAAQAPAPAPSTPQVDPVVRGTDEELVWSIALALAPANPLGAVRVAFCESGFSQFATGAAGERGYWQIHPTHFDSTYDPWGNGAAMARISGGGVSFGAWAGGLGDAWAAGAECGPGRPGYGG